MKHTLSVRRWTMVAAVLVMTGAAIRAQRPLRDDAGQVSFEVTSVKASRGIGDKSLGTSAPGLFAATGVTLHDLIATSYGGIAGRLGDARIVDEPSWVSSQRWDVTGKTQPENGLDRMFLMVQTLLKDRFGLQLTIVQREGAVFVLSRRQDDRLGPGLTRSAIDCAALLPQVLAGAKWPSGVDWCGWRYQPGDPLHVEGRGVTIGEFAARLEQSPSIARPVVDHTQLSGTFDVTLEYSPNPATSDTGSDRVSIFTALDERLGLKLTGGRASVDVFAVKAAHLPQPD